MTPPTDHATVRKSLIGAACLSLQPLALNALSVPAMAFIIHQLGASGFAQWMAAVSLLSFLAVLTNLGLRSAFVRAVAAEPSRASELLAEQLGLRLTLSAAAGFVAIAASWLLGYSESVIWCAVIGAAALALSTTSTSMADVLQSIHRIKTLSLVNLISGLALTAASVVAASQDASPTAMAAAYLTGPALSTVMLLTIVKKHLGRISLRWSPSKFRSLLTESRFLAAQQLLFAASAQAEALLSPRILGMQTFGLFAAGAMLANRLVALPDALCAAAYPVMVQAWRRGTRFGALVTTRYLAVAVLGGIGVAIGATAISAPLGRLLLPEHADLFANVVRVTIWAIPLISIELVLGYGLNAAGQDAIQARLAVFASTVSLAGSVALVAGLGFHGACWSMLFRPAIRVAFLCPVSLRTFMNHADTLNTAPAGCVIPVPERKAA